MMWNFNKSSLVKYYLTWFSFKKGASLLLQTSSMVSAIWELQKPSCLLKTEAFSNSAFSMSCITRSLCATGPHFFITYIFIYLLYVVIKCTHPYCLWHLCCIEVYLGFCCPNSLDVRTVFLYFSKFICIFFHFLYTSFLEVLHFLWKCLGLARSSVVIHAGLLAFLPGGSALEFGGGNPWTLTSYLGPVFPAEDHPMGPFQEDLWKAQSLISWSIGLWSCFLPSSLTSRA